MDDVFIFGAGGLGSLVRDTLIQAGKYRTVAFLDSHASSEARAVDGVPVIGGIEQVDPLRDRGVSRGIVAIGHNQTRVELSQRLEELGVELISAIHPLSSISPTTELGRHLIIGARTTLCVNAKIGPHCVLASGAIVDHDCVIGEGVFLHPAVRLAGGVHVEALATLGIGASAIPGRRIGRAAHVGPGAVVIRDVVPGTHVEGVPATQRLDRPTRFVTQ